MKAPGVHGSRAGPTLRHIWNQLLLESVAAAWEDINDADDGSNRLDFDSHGSCLVRLPAGHR
jgi:hypothetical protein